METINSSLTPLLFSLTRLRPELNILDLGIGSEKTIQLFREHSVKRFFFLDVGRHVGLSYPINTLKQVSKSLNSDIKFDVCLLWDYLNIMSDEVIDQLIEDLLPRVTKDTLLYGFLANSPRTPMFFRRYALAKRDQLELLDLNEYLARYPRTRRDIEERIKNINFLNITRYPDNRQEILATFTDD